MTLDPAQFEYIVVDGDSMYPWEFVREATDYANAKEKDIIADEVGTLVAVWSLRKFGVEIRGRCDRFCALLDQP